MTARYKALAPTLLGSILLAACGASDDTTDSAPSGQASPQAVSENPAEQGLIEFPSRIDTMYAITRAFPGTGCSDRIRFSRNDRCTTGSGSITIDTRGEEVRDLMLLTTSIDGTESDLYRFLAAFGINDGVIMEWASEAAQSTTELERDAGAFRLAARRGRGEELRLIITDDGSASAAEAERQAIANSPILMSVEAANSAPTDLRLALLYFKFNPSALESDTGAAYFAALNNPDRYAEVASNEFDRPDYLAQVRAQAPAFLRQLDPVVTLSFPSGLGAYDAGSGTFPVGCTSVDMCRPFELDVAQGNMPPVGVNLPMVSGNELRFTRYSAVGTAVALEPAFSIASITVPADRARAFVQAQPAERRSVTINIEVEITDAFQQPNSHGLAAGYNATPRAFSIVGARAGGEIYRAGL